ncbi:MAG: ATP-binding protein [Tindallia sp. MSAO_Bac2]|nr:MAG: ATP-binding protein [Tindallia sp. MSAO_Bac2]
MKILKIRYDQIGLFKNGFEIDLTASDRVTKDMQVQELYRSIYTQNVIGIIGINATGKSTALKLINMAMDIILDNKGLENIDIPSGIIKDGTTLTVYFYKESNFYKISSKIGYKDNQAEGYQEKNKYYFKEEVIYSKRKSTVQSKDQLYDFNNANEEINRGEIEIEGKKTFLKDQDSIVSAITAEETVKHFDMIMDTNFNILWTKGIAKAEFVSLFDQSIDQINVEKDKATITFKNSSQDIQAERLIDIHHTLSSGTIKGINLFEKASLALKTGGYLIIDEIENHMHKKLVQTIIRFFMDPDVNKKGATLIFSTHYAEIIDTIERKDSIYVFRKTPDLHIEVIKYSEKIKRNDIKKSEVFLSNLIDGTAPSYEDVQIVRKYLCQ